MSLEISLVAASEVISDNAGDGKVLQLADGEAGGEVSTGVRLRESGQTETDVNTPLGLVCVETLRRMVGAVDDPEPVLDDAAGRGVSTRFCLRESDQTETDVNIPRGLVCVETFR